MKFISILVGGLMFCGYSIVEGKPATSPIAEAINSNCRVEATTAGCMGKKVGTGLIRCLHAYKKSNRDFQFSPACAHSLQMRKKRNNSDLGK